MLAFDVTLSTPNGVSTKQTVSATVFYFLEQTMSKEIENARIEIYKLLSTGDTNGTK